ncbi:hypothetical protein [Anaerotignum neopropionicum]|nr:hypothetical protein [Anaerotignum neopropionicum]
MVEDFAEKPPHHDIYYILTMQPIQEKVYIIADERETDIIETMLFANEY